MAPFAIIYHNSGALSVSRREDKRRTSNIGKAVWLSSPFTQSADAGGLKATSLCGRLIDIYASSYFLCANMRDEKARAGEAQSDNLAVILLIRYFSIFRYLIKARSRRLLRNMRQIKFKVTNIRGKSDGGLFTGSACLASKPPSSMRVIENKYVLTSQHRTRHQALIS